MMNRAYLLLGGNLGNPEKNLAFARKFIADAAGTISRESCLYQTAAWGDQDQPDFLNQVLLLQTSLSAEALLAKLLAIEHQLGRVRTQKNAARIIDIDILYFNGEVIHQPNLTIPHPAIAERRFALVPLVEISPDYVHPVLLETNSELLEKCTDQLDVKKI
ncbi:MAG: sulD [Ferruginibacter sp.]|nr:sulD [Ferruginibacter sp.]